MGNELNTFDFNTNTIRVIEIGGEPWFVARDACEALMMPLYAGTTQWMRGLADDERKLVTRKDVPEIFSGSRAPSLSLVSESGLYTVALRSTNEAAAFQDWVTRVVLPAIRKDGGYIAGEENMGQSREGDLAVIAAGVPEGDGDALYFAGALDAG